MFVDQINITVTAGTGGDGSASFARAKYMPFGGPDGGDGGRGGNVVLYGDKGTESLIHFNNLKLIAPRGGNGAAGLKNGLMAEDLLIRIPLGTIVYDARSGVELGDLLTGESRLLCARGGKGGRGNPHFRTSTNQAPKTAEDGKPGQAKDLLLKYRIFGHYGLIEPCPEEATLLPLLLNRDIYDIDSDLYFDKPRWIRIQHEFVNYDPVYLPLLVDDGQAGCPLIAQIYWLEKLFINLVPYGDQASVACENILRQISQTDHPQLKTIIVAGVEADAYVENPDLADEQITVEVISGSIESIHSAFLNGLTGGVVE